MAGNKRNRWDSITKSSSKFSFPSFLLLEEEVGFFYGLIIMVIGGCHESGTRLTVTRFTESRADEKENRRLRRCPGTEIIDWEMGREN